jgi:hypothetical protein
MPVAMERALKKTARKKFPGNEERQDAYVYGTLRKTGWKPKKRGKKSDTSATIVAGLMK